MVSQTGEEKENGKLLLSLSVSVGMELFNYHAVGNHFTSSEAQPTCPAVAAGVRLTEQRHRGGGGGEGSRAGLTGGSSLADQS